MDRWDPIHLTSTFRPVLEPHETIQTTQDQVGLYDGRQKAEDYPNGTVYLTSFRLLYIDAKDPARKSIGLPLWLISGIQHYGGFMSSSPKITLELYPHSISVDPLTPSDLVASQGSGSGIESGIGSLTLKSQPSWVCSICYNSNQGSFAKCAVCGVKKPLGTQSIPSTPVTNPSSLSFDESAASADMATISSQGSFSSSASATPLPAEQTGIACPACTFQNDPFMIQCEICGSELQDAESIAFMLHRQQQHQRSISHLPSSISGTPSTSTPEPMDQPPKSGRVSQSSGLISSLSSMMNTRGSSVNASIKAPTEDTNSVKLSFRAGGIGNFHSTLKSAMGTKAWETKAREEESAVKDLTKLSASPEVNPSLKVGGISGIMRSVESNKIETDQVLSQAFRDLQGLMDKAAEMVTLAESISNRLSKSNTLNNEETATFKTYLLSMGIAAPVTKDTAGAVFHKELARELVDFILPIVEREGGTMSLMDIYCVFNRARGVELISPKDLHSACQLFTELNLPLRLRKFDSGLLVIQTLARYSDDEVSTSISQRIQSLPPGVGITASELASAIQISVALAQDQLLMTEARGLICRDESVEGIRFFDNLFTNWEL